MTTGCMVFTVNAWESKCIWLHDAVREDKRLGTASTNTMTELADHHVVVGNVEAALHSRKPDDGRYL